MLVLAGELHGFDVGAAAHPTAYGSMAATLFASPGTAVRCAVLWASAAQLTQLSWTEITYRLGRLDGVRFTPDQPGSAPLDGLWAYVSRWGPFSPEGTPLAFSAVPARHRRAPAATQEELLGYAARLALGPEAGAEQLVRRIFEAPGALLREGGSAAIRAAGVPFAPPEWRPFAPPG